MFRREYFYYLNERGNLFHLYDLEAFLKGKIPGGPVFLKDERQLDFFFRRLERTTPQNGSKWISRFPFVSTCGIAEGNFLACSHSPVVFHDISLLPPSDEDEATPTSVQTTDQCKQQLQQDETYLTFAGTLRQPFLSRHLRVCSEGRLYHPVTVLQRLNKTTKGRETTTTTNLALDDKALLNDEGAVYGPFGSSIGMKLGFDYVCDEKTEEGDYLIEWEGVKHTVAVLERPFSVAPNEGSEA